MIPKRHVIGFSFLLKMLFHNYLILQVYKNDFAISKIIPLVLNFAEYFLLLYG